MDKVIEQIHLNKVVIQDAFNALDVFQLTNKDEKHIVMLEKVNIQPFIKALQSYLPTTSATSWEEVYNKAQEHAATMGSHGIFGEVNFTDSVEATSYYQNLINYLSQHWPSTQPVSPTPMAETWEELKKKAYEHACTVYGNPDDSDGFHWWLQHYNNYLFSSLHQVDRWVEIRTNAEKEALTKVKEEFRLYYAREDYYGEAWQHFHKERIHKYTLEIIDNTLK